MSKTGYGFASWKKDNAGTAYGSGANITDAALTQIDGVITFWAEWTPHIYTVTYNTNSATSGSPSKTTDTHVYGKDYTLATRNTLQKTGYTFKGWTTTSDGSGTVYTAGATTSDADIKNRTSDITFYAKWEVASYSITYNLNGGTNSTGAKTAYTIADATFSLPTPTKSGYTFAGWYTSDSFTGSAVAQIATGSTGNMTFWAKWDVEKAAKVIFNGDTTTYDSFSDAWDAANSKATSSTRRATVVMLKNIDEKPSSYYKVESGKYITLDLNGYTLDRGLANAAPVSDGYVIYVGGTLGSNLILKDSIGVGKITGGNNNSYGGGVHVRNGSSFTMEGGTICKNTSKYGGGVYVHPSGRFSMSGGIICDNTATACGGGVYIDLFESNGRISRGKFNISGSAYVDTNNDIYLRVYNFPALATYTTSINVSGKLLNDGIVGRIKPEMYSNTAQSIVILTKDQSVSTEDFSDAIKKFEITPSGTQKYDIVWAPEYKGGVLKKK